MGIPWVKEKGSPESASQGRELRFGGLAPPFLARRLMLGRLFLDGLLHGLFRLGLLYGQFLLLLDGFLVVELLFVVLLAGLLLCLNRCRWLLLGDHQWHDQSVDQGARLMIPGAKA